LVKKQGKETSDATFREILQRVACCKSYREVESLLLGSYPARAADRHLIYALRSRARLRRKLSFLPAFFYWHLHKDGTSSDYLNSVNTSSKIIWQNHN